MRFSGDAVKQTRLCQNDLRRGQSALNREWVWTDKDVGLQAQQLLPKVMIWALAAQSSNRVLRLRRGERTPIPKISASPRKLPVLLRADVVLTGDPNQPYKGQCLW